MLTLRFADQTLPPGIAIGALLAEGAALSGALAELDKQSGGRVARALRAAEFTGKAGQSVTVLAPAEDRPRLVVAGLGARDKLTPLAVEEAGATLAAALAREPEAAIATDDLPPDHAAHLALGAALRAWTFDRYRTKQKPEDAPKLATLTVLTAKPGDAETAWHAAQAVANGVALTRELVSEPANILTPAEFARRIEGLREHGLEIEVFDEKALAELGFGAMLGVAQGSANPPRMVVMRWQGGGDEKPLAFIGKGVTFDTGGISIKPAQGMEDMKWDMAGAGTVTGLMAALAGRRAKVNAVGLVGLVENMPSGTAQRPGDVVKSYSGQTIEVLNTDAEGRLVLADVLWYAQQKFDPRIMVDLATLTGAIIIALGHEHAGLFSNDDELAGKLAASGLATGEKVWRLPLGTDYDKQLKSDIADMKNITGRPGSSITAAQFLQRFVNDKPWAHLDIAGTAWASKDQKIVAKGATAFGVRLLDHLVASYENG